MEKFYEPSNDGQMDSPSPLSPNAASPSKRDKLIGLTKTSLAKVKELKPHQDINRKNHEHDNPVPGMTECDDGLNRNAAFNTRTLHNHMRENEKAKGAQTSSILKSAGRNLLNPKQAIKTQAKRATASKLSTAERSFLSQEADHELLQAHDCLEDAETEAATGESALKAHADAASTDQLAQARRKVEGIEKQRESLRAAWITSHQVFRVQVVPSTPYQPPNTKAISAETAQGQWVKLILQFLGRGMLYYMQDSCTVHVDESGEPQFSLATLQNNAERLVIASAAWQSWLCDLGTVYRWEDPFRTGRWLAISILLWYTEHIVGFLYGYIMYIVIKNRFAPTSIQSIRDSVGRAADSETRATRFVELIDKHGAQGWLDAVCEEMGPSLQLIIVDLGNYVEVLANFYYWKAPYRTSATLVFFASCLAVTLFADMAFCIKLVWFVAGGTFFFLWPIASLYPKYRALVSPVRWVFWGIPTHAEWAFQYLRYHAQEHREQLVKQKNPDDSAMLLSPFDKDHSAQWNEIESLDKPDDADSSSGDEHWGSSQLDEDIRFFRAIDGKTPGRLVVSTKAVRFVSKLTKAEDWRLPFLTLAKMWKAESRMASILNSERSQLAIQDIAGTVRLLSGIRERDDAFNSIIAFSGLRWQNLQPR